MTTAVSAPTADLTLLSRYVLDVRVGGADESPVWRGTDSRLRRPVAVRLLAADDPRAERVRSQAQRAATFTDRRAVPVLDVGYDKASGLLAVVSDWVPALGFGDYLAARGPEPLPAREAAGITLELARCLAAAHALGLGHGRLHPNSLLITDSGEIRLRGLGLGEVLSTADSEAAPFPQTVHEDIRGVGAILYAGLTGRWPGASVDNVPAVARLASGALPWPSRVVADVPPALDDVAARTIDACALPRGRTAFTDMTSVVTALATAVDPVETRVAPASTRSGPNVAFRAVAVTLAVLLTVGIAALGVSLLRGPVVAPVPDNHSEQEAIGLGLTTPPVAPTSGPLAPSGASTVVPIVAVHLLDPDAGDRPERSDRVPLAWDGKPATAWTTLRYRSPDMAGKKGVGLLIDLGAPRPVSSVRLVLVGNNSTVAVRAGDTVEDAPKGYRMFARAKGAPTEVTLRSVQPVTARYLAVWLTRLPPNGDAYRGGVAEVSVRS